jgi:rubredoxin
MILPGTVECRNCGLTYETAWVDDSDTLQDMDEAPSEWQECPECRTEQFEQYPGWVNRTEAG